MSGKKTMVVAGIIIIAVAMIGVVFISNYKDKKTVTTKTTTTNSQGQKEIQTKTTEVTKATDIKSALAAWKEAGLTVSDDQGAYYQMIGASSGGKYTVSSTEVELYEFSDNTKANGAKTSYFASDSDTVLVSGTLLIYIHSTDETQTAPIKAVF